MNERYPGHSKGELFRLLPCVIGVSKVPVRRSLEVLRLLEVELLDCGRRRMMSACACVGCKHENDVPMTPGLRSQFLRMISTISSSVFLPVPYVSTKMDKGSATPMAYDSWTKTRRAMPAATKDLAAKQN